MTDYNIERSDKDFYKGKRLLDTGRYREAIDVYNALIEYASNYTNEPDAILTLETSYNNRGLSLCKLGLMKHDKAIYLKGMEDFKTSIKFTENEEEKLWLTAYSNLKFSEKEIETFDKLEKPDNSFFRSI